MFLKHRLHHPLQRQDKDKDPHYRNQSTHILKYKRMMNPTKLISLLSLTILFFTSQVASETSAEGKLFLANKAKEEGVTVLPSGLHYKEITPGTGELYNVT